MTTNKKNIKDLLWITAILFVLMITTYIFHNVSTKLTAVQLSADTGPKIQYQDKKWVKISSGENHCAAITEDGSLWTWGANDKGQLGDGTYESKPYAVKVMGNVTEVKCGTGYTAAIKEDHSLWLFGDNRSYQLGDGSGKNRNVPFKILDNVQKVFCYTSYMMAIQNDLSLWVWGDYPWRGSEVAGKNSTPMMLEENVLMASGDYSHAAILKTDGSVWTLGTNANGQLGDGTRIDKQMPVKVFNHAKDVVCGGNYTIVLGKDGTVWSWGNNDEGQLGDGSTVEKTIQMKVLEDVNTLQCLDDKVYALKNDKSLWGWGDNTDGTLGSDTTLDIIDEPTHIFDDVIAFDGYYHYFVIKTDGTLWGWGKNDWGQIGDGTSIKRNEPIKVLSGVRSVCCGYNHTIAIREDDTLWSWGENYKGQLCDGTFMYNSTPIQIAEGIKRISCGDDHVSAITENNSLLVWGANDYGQLGDGSYKHKALPIGLLEGVKKNICKYDQTVILKEDGTLWAWGKITVTEPGEYPPDITQPVKIMDNVMDFDCNGQYIVAIKEDYSAWLTGTSKLKEGEEQQEMYGYFPPFKVLDNIKNVVFCDYNALFIGLDGSLWRGSPDRADLSGRTLETELLDSNVIAVDVSRDMIAYIKQNNNLYIYPNNVTPILMNVISVNCNQDNLYAIKKDKTLWALGNNYHGQIGDGTKEHREKPVKVLDGVTSVVSGDGHVLALTEEGSLYTWGDNLRGQLGDGTKQSRAFPHKVLENVISMACNDTNSYAICQDNALYGWGFNLYGTVGDGYNRFLPKKAGVVQTGEKQEGLETEPQDQAIFEPLSKEQFPELTELYPYQDNTYQDDESILFIGRDGEIYRKGLYEDIPELIADEKLARFYRYDDHAILLFTNGNLYNYDLNSQEKTLIESNIRDFSVYDNILRYYINDITGPDGANEIKLNMDNKEYSSVPEYGKIYSKAKSFTDQLENIEYPIFLCAYNGWYYFSVSPTPAGGSGEIYGWPESGTYFGVNQDGTEIKEFHDFRPEYISERDKWLYFLDLKTAEQFYYPGRGKMYKMKPDGTELTELTSDIAYDGYYRYQGYLIYRTEDHGMVRMKEDGSERKVIYNNELDDLQFFGDWMMGDLELPPYDTKLIIKLDGSHASKIPEELEKENVLNWNDESFFFLTDDKRLIIYNNQ